MTYVPPYELTKMDIAAMRKCTHIIVRRDPDAKVYCSKSAERNANDPFAQDIHYNIAAPVEFAHRWDMVTDRCTAFAMLWNFPTQVTQLSSILATLRVGDAIKFRFSADDHSSPALLEVGFHGDVLYLEVYRAEKQVANWEFQTVICSDNSARMIKGAVKRVFPETETA